MNEILIPEKLEPIVKAFFAESPKMAKELILQATRAIYATDNPDHHGYQREVTKDEIEGVLSLMAGIKPNDLLEALLASQIVAGHLIGMRKLASEYPDDLRIGLKMLRFSGEAMGNLQRKRCGGGNQQITVNYNYKGGSHAD